jgi:hypothetical protein
MGRRTVGQERQHHETDERHNRADLDQLRTSGAHPGTAITIAAASAAKDPSFSEECDASTVKTTHGISAMKMPLPPPLGCALSLLFDDMEVSLRLT